MKYNKLDTQVALGIQALGRASVQLLSAQTARSTHVLSQQYNKHMQSTVNSHEGPRHSSRMYAYAMADSAKLLTSEPCKTLT